MVLFSAGDQVPAIPFREVVGNGLIKAPLQMGPTGLNRGITDVPVVLIVTATVEVQPRESLAVTV